MNTSQPIEVLLHDLHAALALMAFQNPNRSTLQEAWRYTEKSRRSARTSGERAALLRIASSHLQRAGMTSLSVAENEALIECRRAMTAALFEHARGPVSSLSSDASALRDP
jgi:hypothetical protein